MKNRLFKNLKYNEALTPLWKILAFPIGGALWFWFFFVRVTSKVEVVGEGSNFSGPAIYVNWHQYLPFLILHHGQKGRWILVSKAPYMEPIARWCAWAGLRLIRGASKESGPTVLPQLVEKLREGESITLAVDGPGGPAFKCKRGCIDLSRLAQVPIIPVAYVCEKGKPNRRRWDMSLVPRPFDRITVIYGKPVVLDPRESENEPLRTIESALNSLLPEAANPPVL